MYINMRLSLAKLSSHWISQRIASKKWREWNFNLVSVCVMCCDMFVFVSFIFVSVTTYIFILSVNCPRMYPSLFVWFCSFRSFVRVCVFFL